MKVKALLPWLLAVLSAILLDLPFPISGPLPPWRAIFAWIAFVPLFVALFGFEVEADAHPLRRGTLLGYLTGTLWYAANCSWVYDTMHLYGDLSPLVSAVIVLVCALILGGYFAFFGFLLSFLAHRFNRGIALLAAPFLWVAIDLLAYHFTSIPWDQLGYSQINNPNLLWLAPITGVYGITFVLLLSNSSIFCLYLLKARKGIQLSTPRRYILVSTLVLIWVLIQVGTLLIPDKPPPPTATATLIQPNLDVGAKQYNPAASLSAINSEGRVSCQPYLAGLPETGLALQTRTSCEPGKSTLIVWPEAPSPLYDVDTQFRQTVSKLTKETHATAVIGVMGVDTDSVAPTNGRGYQIYNSATVTAPDGTFVGRYDKIHLVPFGEFVPFKDELFFLGQITQGIGELSRGTTRKVFNTDGHRYGVFICYEAVFADEVRQFAALGADVLVNVSDDGWYGDTSAPWQHLNIARMRAVENHRWILRDTNNGITAVIDPYGRVTASIPRHQFGALTAPFGYEHVTTFYTTHGDLFAYLCAILSLLLLLRAQPYRLGRKSKLNQKSGLQ